MQIEGKMKVYFSNAICSDYVCTCFRSRFAFFIVLSTNDPKYDMKKIAALCGHKFLYCSYKDTEPQKSDYNSVRTRLVRKETKSFRKVSIR